MNKSNRDLLVLFNQESMSSHAIEHEVGMLHELLYTVERIDNLAVAHEVINLNRYKVINQSLYVKKILRRKTLKPFVFLSNKN